MTNFASCYAVNTLQKPGASSLSLQEPVRHRLWWATNMRGVCSCHALGGLCESRGCITSQASSGLNTTFIPAQAVRQCPVLRCVRFLKNHCFCSHCLLLPQAFLLTFWFVITSHLVCFCTIFSCLSFCLSFLASEVFLLPLAAQTAFALRKCV